MPIAIVAGHTTASRATSGTSLVINAPTHAAGDVLYVLYASDGDGDTASLTGFTSYGPISIEGGAGVFYRFIKTATGSEPASYTISNTVAERAVAFAFAVRDDNGINATGTNQAGTGTSASLPAVTSTVDNALRISVMASNKDATPVATGTGLTLLGTVAVTSGGTLSVQYKALGAAGTDGAVTVTITSQPWLGHTIAIAPVVSNVLVDPGPASAASGAPDPTLILGSTVAAPGSADAASGAVDPAIILGALLVAPGSADATGTAQVAAVLGGGIALSPGSADAISDAVGPTLVWGSTMATPGPAEAASSAVLGSAVGGGVLVDPGAAAAASSAVISATIQGSISITPEWAEAASDALIAAIVVTGRAIAAVALTLTNREIVLTLVPGRRSLTVGEK